MIIEEVWLKVVNTKLKGPEPLADECLRAIECRYQRVHQHVEVREERAREG